MSKQYGTFGKICQYRVAQKMMPMANVSQGAKYFTR